MITAISTYLNVKDNRENAAKRKPFVYKYHVLKRQIEENKLEDEESKFKLEQAEMVVRTFEIRKYKHILEDNGQNTDYFVNYYLNVFREYPEAFELVMNQVVENEDMDKKEEELQERVGSRVRQYNTEMAQIKSEVNRMSDEDNKG